MPTALKRLHNVRPDRINDLEPVPSLGEIIVPDWLPAAAREVWAALAPDLIAKQVLTFWDVDMFATLCQTVVLHRRAMADLDENGTSILVVARVLASGETTYRAVRNPNWQVARESGQLLITLAARFGLTPADRSQMHIEPSSTKKPGRLDPERLLS